MDSAGPRAASTEYQRPAPAREPVRPIQEDGPSLAAAPAPAAHPSAVDPSAVDPSAVDPSAAHPSEVDTGYAVRRWWDGEADAYQAEHGAFLGDVNFVWGPEGLNEADAHVLGDVAGRRVLEVGCGAGQCGRWLVTRRAHVVGLDVSAGQLRHSGRLDGITGVALPVVQADAGRLPFPPASFDMAFSSYGALPFVADATAVLREVARVLRPGGRFAFSTAHPVRWAFPDDPSERGLAAVYSYFDRRPYLEYDERGEPVYAEYHRTVGDWVRCIGAAGMQLIDLVEPEWPADNDQTWGGWSPLRGRIVPGTAIFVCRKP